MFPVEISVGTGLNATWLKRQACFCWVWINVFRSAWIVIPVLLVLALHLYQLVGIIGVVQTSQTVRLRVWFMT